ncbi:uncharacterized protein [Diabrotica undecimpunctata]|uniref:uncharacterized protein n=1 Tax=Diabrotica undecimpunctata TaxID=50387 RepID=UPI003B63EBDD
MAFTNRTQRILAGCHPNLLLDFKANMPNLLGGTVEQSEIENVLVEDVPEIMQYGNEEMDLLKCSKNCSVNTDASSQILLDIPEIMHYEIEEIDTLKSSENCIVNKDAILSKEKEQETLHIPRVSNSNKNVKDVQNLVIEKTQNCSFASSTRSSSSSSNSSSSSSTSSSDSDSENEPFGSDDSVKDPPYIKSSSDSDDIDSSREAENINLSKNRKLLDPSKTEKKGKKRLRNPGLWQKNIAKQLRNSGQSYVGLISVKTENGSQKKIKEKRPKRMLKPPCGEKCKLQCSQKIDEQQRLNIFNDYWGLQDLEKQRHYISSNMQSINPRYKYSNAANPRNPNNAYSFIIDNKTVRVCKYFFLATLSINNRVIQTVLKKQKVCESGKIVETDKRGTHNNHYKVDEEIKSEIRSHINSIPRIDSHYCRSHTSKQYIEGNKTLADLHRDYLKSCEEKQRPAANYHMYRKIFEEEFNIAFYIPKKDQCDLCLQFKNSSIIEQQNILEKVAKKKIMTEILQKILK